MQIETEQPEDATAVDAVVSRAFERDAVVTMVNAIRGSDRYRPEYAFVARIDDAVVGFVMLSGIDLIEADGTVHPVLSLTPLAVDPDHQRQGIGTALVRTALAAADAAGEGLIVLEGDPRYYGPRGFVFAPDHSVTIDLPGWAPKQAAQVAILSNYDPAVRGHVVYPPAIAAVSE